MKQHQAPLKPLVFEILLALVDGAAHGYGLAKTLEARPGAPRVLPANLYRTLRDLCAQGWLAESDRRPGPDEDRRRRYFKLTESGLDGLRRESERLERLVLEARTKRVLAFDDRSPESGSVS